MKVKMFTNIISLNITKTLFIQKCFTEKVFAKSPIESTVG